ncbi:pseudouridine synthase [Limosilactobacillus sp.]|uniref:pseudouridine synthase n=1 Tax=Limosilactobacillus sp. TaxID=2773925 RepID=UPI00345E6C02
MAKERLQKVMAEAGIASRRQSEKIIAAGRVEVNGQVVREQGVKVSSQDEIKVDGVPIEKEQLEYYLLDKPREVISSAHDEKGRRTVVDILKDGGVSQRVYPVGRLDYDTTGALLMTNDGALANKLMHPRFEVDKTYVAKLKGIITNEEMKKLRQGVMIDGRLTHEAHPRLEETDHEKKTCIVRITIHEGHYHQVKRMFAAVGHPVTKLHRERYAFLNLHGLMPGQFRKLRTAEVEALRKL